MDIEKVADQLNEMSKLMRESRDSFIRQVLIMATSLLGILVSLHKTPASTFHTRMAFSLAILSLAIGILALTCSIYYTTALYKKHRSYRKEELLQQLNNPYYQVTPHSIRPGKLYEFSEKVGYTSLLVAVISLAVYAVGIA